MHIAMATMISEYLIAEIKRCQLCTIFNRDEYVPMEALAIPHAAITTLRATCRSCY